MKTPIIHIHIGSLIQKVEISTTASDSKTDLDSSQAILHSYLNQVQGSLTECLISVLQNAVKTFEDDLTVGKTPKTESH